MERWVGKVAVVTGASAGIGEAITCALAEKGLVVTGLARRVDKIQDIAKRSKGVIHAIKCDVSIEKDILSAFKWIEKNLGRVDLLVNNAAIFKLTDFTDAPTADWRETLDVNVLGLCISSREALKIMRKTGDDGVIININSTAGHSLENLKNIGIYAASKHAVTALSQGLRIDLGNMKSGIRVTSISPGLVYTDMARNAIKEWTGANIGSESSQVPAGFLAPQDIADAVIAVITMKPRVQIDELTLNGKGSVLYSDDSMQKLQK